MAIIPATYISAASFSIEGEYDSRLPTGRKLMLYQGLGGNVEVAVVSAIYGAGDTTIIVSPESVLSTLVNIELGPDTPDSVAEHDHTGVNSGGFIPASALSQDEVDMVQGMPLPSVGDANKFLRQNAAGDDYEAASLLGTTNQIDVDHDGDETTLSTPQDLDATATPIFAGMTLTSLDGVLIADGSNPLTGIAATAANQFLKSNPTNTGYIFGDPPELVTPSAAGQMLVSVSDGEGGHEWDLLPAPGGLDLVIRSVDSGGGVLVPEWSGLTIGVLSDVHDDFDDDPRGGDMFVFGGSLWEPMRFTEAGPTYPPEGAIITYRTVGDALHGAVEDIGWGHYNVIDAGTAGETLAADKVVYKATATGKWKLAQQDGTDEEKDASGITLEAAASADDPVKVLLWGKRTISGASFTPGKRLWLSDTAGEFTETKPVGVTRPLAHADTATEIFFNP